MPSASELKTRYAQLSDENLRAIVLHPGDYTAEALLVAEECLRERGLSTEGPEADWTQITVEKEELDVEHASLGLKVFFFFFPGIGCIVILAWFIQSIRGKSDPRIAQVVPSIILGYITWTVLYWLFFVAIATDYR